MAATRRSFFGFLFGAAAVAPALPEIIAAVAEAAPIKPPTSRFVRVMYHHAIRENNVLLSATDYAGVPQCTFRGVPIRVRTKLPPQEWRKLTS